MILAVSSRIGIANQRIYESPVGHGTQVAHWITNMARGVILGKQTANINPLNTKRRPLYLKTKFVPRSKHFSSRL